MRSTVLSVMASAVLAAIAPLMMGTSSDEPREGSNPFPVIEYLGEQETQAQAASETSPANTGLSKNEMLVMMQVNDLQEALADVDEAVLLMKQQNQASKVQQEKLVELMDKLESSGIVQVALQDDGKAEGVGASGLDHSADQCPCGCNGECVTLEEVRAEIEKTLYSRGLTSRTVSSQPATNYAAPPANSYPTASYGSTGGASYARYPQANYGSSASYGSTGNANYAQTKTMEVPAGLFGWRTRTVEVPLNAAPQGAPRRMQCVDQYGNPIPCN